MDYHPSRSQCIDACFLQSVAGIGNVMLAGRGRRILLKGLRMYPLINCMVIFFLKVRFRFSFLIACRDISC